MPSDDWLLVETLRCGGEPTVVAAGVPGIHYYVLNKSEATERVLNIMMFDIDETVAQFFQYDQYERNLKGETKEDEVKRISEEQTSESGIRDLCPGAIIDPRAFEPCGYSMNEY